ncbi:MAG: hypothetical protein ACK47B_12060 [Armatimonadota bacterium]
MSLRRLQPFAVLFLALGALLPGRALQETPPPRPGEGHLVQWEGWSFRWSVRPREGIVLSDVSFQGRKVLKHASIVEIFVPYDQGQPRPEDSLDGMGVNLVELLPGKDCIPGTICRMLNAEGKEEGKRLVGLHEEYTGLNYLGDQGRSYGKMLVLWGSSRLGKYTYFLRWRFSSDGSMHPDVGLTGRLEHTRPGTTTPHGTQVGRESNGEPVFAPSHVHNFYYRLDFDIDGAADDVVEESSHKQDQPGRSLTAQDQWTPVLREGGRSLDSDAFRTWRVVDKNSKNALGHRRSYELMPGGNGRFRGAAEEAFTQADLWVTRYRPNEFPLSSEVPVPTRLALPLFTNREPLAEQDVVVWYTMSVHHIPRTEDWPAMPVVWAGFNLMPRDFLDGSPLRPQ